MNRVLAPAPASRVPSRSLRLELAAGLVVAAIWLTLSALGVRLPLGYLAAALLTFVALMTWRLSRSQKQLKLELSRLEQTKRELRLQAEQHQTLLQALPDLIFRLDASGVVTRLTPGGVAFGAGEGSRLETMLPGTASETLLRCAQEVLSGQPLGRCAYQLRDGSELLDFEARIARESDGDVLVMVRALTPQKRLEEELASALATALAAARLKTKFLANMSHEIRTPMNGVIGMTNLLMETPLSPEQHEYAQIIQKSGHALLAVIDDILDFAKIEAGKLELEEVDFDLCACVDESVEAVAIQAQLKGLELGAVFAPLVPASVRGDPTRLRQILANLLSNAVRFTESGSVVLYVERSPSHDASLVFSVRDTGPGIPEERRAALFHPVLMGEGALTAPGGGTGLGLAIARELVQLMGGEIACRTVVGEGSSFEFTARLENRDAGRGSVELASLSGARAWVVTLRERAEPIWPLSAQLAALGVDSEVAEPATAARMLAEHRRELACLALIVDASVDHALVERILSEVRRGAAARDTALVLLAPPNLELAEQLRAQAARVLSWPVRQAELSACLSALYQRPRRLAAESGSELTALTAHVLVADDDPINQRILRRMLLQLGCTCEVASDGKQAVERALATHFDAVLMDCQMPWLDGFDAARQIRAKEGGVRRNRIVAMTGSSSDEDRRLSRDADMDGFLVKPISSEQLRVVLTQLVPDGHVSDRPSSSDDALIESFVEQAPRNVDAMRAAFDVGDLAAVANAAQQLAAFGRSLGQARLFALSSELQRAAEGARVSAAERALESVSAELSSVWRSVRERREQLPEPE